MLSLTYLCIQVSEPLAMAMNLHVINYMLMHLFIKDWRPVITCLFFSNLDIFMIMFTTL